MENKKFSPRDAKLIRDYPNIPPEELLALGLSRAAYARLASNEKAVPQKLEPAKVEAAPLKTATGRLSNHVVSLLNKTSNVVIELGYRAAFILSEQSPEKYQILSK